MIDNHVTRDANGVTGNAFALILVPAVLIPVLFYSTTYSMARIWTINETFSHGFLVFPVTLWLLYTKRQQLALLKPEADLKKLILMIPFLLAWLIGDVTSVEVVQQLCMISFILLTVYVSTGYQVFKVALFPLMLLYFSVPLGQALIPPLMHFTASFTISLVELAGIPVYQDGLSFVLPGGSWSVVEECSGVRYLIASFYLGTIYAYLSYTSVKKRLIFILLSLVIPVIGNGLRAFGIVLIGHYTDMEYAVGTDHLLYGWLFFGIMIFMLFYIGSFWSDTGGRQMNGTAPGVSCDRSDSVASIVLTTLLTYALLISTLSFSIYIETGKRTSVYDGGLQLPVSFSEWLFDEKHTSGWRPVYTNPDENISRTYRRDSDRVQLDIAYYFDQREDSEAVSSSNKLTNPYGGIWKLVREHNQLYGGQRLTESELAKGEDKLLVWSWYRVGRYESNNIYLAKLLEIYNLIFEGRSDAALIAISTDHEESVEVARDKLRVFMRDASAGITTSIEGMLSSRPSD